MKIEDITQIRILPLLSEAATVSAKKLQALSCDLFPLLCLPFTFFYFQQRNVAPTQASDGYLRYDGENVRERLHVWKNSQDLISLFDLAHSALWSCKVFLSDTNQQISSPGETYLYESPSPGQGKSPVFQQQKSKSAMHSHLTLKLGFSNRFVFLKCSTFLKCHENPFGISLTSPNQPLNLVPWQKKFCQQYCFLTPLTKFDIFHTNPEFNSPGSLLFKTHI